LEVRLSSGNVYDVMGSVFFLLSFIAHSVYSVDCNSIFSGLGSDLSVGRMVRGEGAWVVCVCISYTGGEGQLGCNFLWSGRGDWGGQGNCRKSSWLNDK